MTRRRIESRQRTTFCQYCGAALHDDDPLIVKAVMWVVSFLLSLMAVVGAVLVAWWILVIVFDYDSIMW
jgi:hypothetical protein